MARTKDQLSDDVIRILRALRTVPEDERERRAVLTRDLAEASVAIREHFLTPEGAPDWTGRTWTYRDAIRNLYGEAGYSPEERAQTQGAVRYHVGNIVRRYLSPDALEDAGLRQDTPRERQQATRARNSALLSALATSTSGGTDIELNSAAKVEALRDVLAAISKIRLNKRNGRALAKAAAEGDDVAAGLIEAAAKLTHAIRAKCDELLSEMASAGLKVE